MKHLTRALCLVLPFLLCFSCLTACGGGTAEEPTPTDPSTDTLPDDGRDTETPATGDATESESETETETAPPAPEQGVRIGGADLSEFTVIRSADMPAGQITALELFVEQIRRATGITLPIVTDDQTAEREIIIGVTNRKSAALTEALSEVTDDGYAMVVDGGHLYLGATTGRGVVYGLADLLENYMGVRLYALD